MAGILSPCVKLCAVDPASGLCLGCGRSLAEIGQWLSYSDAERRAIMRILPARLTGMRLEAGAASGSAR